MNKRSSFEWGGWLPVSENSSVVTAMSIVMRAEIFVFGRGVYKGMLYSRYLEQPFVFYNLFTMINRMEELFDSKGFPEAFLSSRTFADTQGKPRKRKAAGNDARREAEMEDSMKQEELRGPGGPNCTFEITVKFRQNATWQGHILWADKNLRQNFRSVLEMLKLIDEALTENLGDLKPVSWSDGGED